DPPRPTRPLRPEGPGRLPPLGGGEPPLERPRPDARAARRAPSRQDQDPGPALGPGPSDARVHPFGLEAVGLGADLRAPADLNRLHRPGPDAGAENPARCRARAPRGSGPARAPPPAWP